MAPPVPSQYRYISKDRLSSILTTAKPILYHDPTLRSTPHSIRSIGWTPTGHLIATGSLDRTIRIWNPDRVSHRHTTELRAGGAVEKVSWNPAKESELLSLGADGIARFWDVRDKKCMHEVKVGGEAFTCAWAGDGGSVIVGRKDDTLVPIDLSTMTALAPYQQNVQTNQMTFTHSTSPSSQTLLLTTGSGRVTIHAYTPQTGPSVPPLHALNAHTSACISLALSPRADILAVGGSDAIISLWDTKEWMCRHALGKMTGPVRTVGFSWDGSFVCGGSDEGTGIEIAHAVSGEYVCRVETSHPAPVVEWHPNRYCIAYAGDPAGLRIVGMTGGL